MHETLNRSSLAGLAASAKEIFSADAAEDAEQK